MLNTPLTENIFYSYGDIINRFIPYKLHSYIKSIKMDEEFLSHISLLYHAKEQDTLNKQLQCYIYCLNVRKNEPEEKIE